MSAPGFLEKAHNSAVWEAGRILSQMPLALAGTSQARCPASEGTVSPEPLFSQQQEHLCD